MAARRGRHPQSNPGEVEPDPDHVHLSRGMHQAAARVVCSREVLRWELARAHGGGTKLRVDGPC